MSKTAGVSALRMRIFLMFLTKRCFKNIRKTVLHQGTAPKDHWDEGDARKEVRESEKVREMEAAKHQTETDGDSCLPERKSSFDVAKKCKN